jgi:hypothetical protein
MSDRSSLYSLHTKYHSERGGTRNGTQTLSYFPSYLASARRGRYVYTNSIRIRLRSTVERYETKETKAVFHLLQRWEHLIDGAAHPPVDLLPILKYVPERWASWKSLCKEVRSLQSELYFGLLSECEERVAKSQSQTQLAFMDEVVERQKELGLGRDIVGLVSRYLESHCMAEFLVQVPWRRFDGGW